MRISAVMCIACLLTHALWAQGNAAWKASSATGYYNDGANWSTDVMPTNAAVATLSATGSYTISAPAGGLVENSTLFMLPQQPTALGHVRYNRHLVEENRSELPCRLASLWTVPDCIDWTTYFQHGVHVHCG